MRDVNAVLVYSDFYIPIFPYLLFATSFENMLACLCDPKHSSMQEMLYESRLVTVFRLQ